MKRTLATALALGALSVALLTGCNRAKAEAPAPPPAATHQTAVTPQQTTTKAGPTDDELNDVDSLLNQVDGQLRSDSQNAPDAD